MLSTNPVMLMHRGVFALLLLAAFAKTVSPQSLLSGKVLSSDSTSINAARVILRDSTGTVLGQTTTDSAGDFRFTIGYLRQTTRLYLSVVRVGFASIELAPVQLSPDKEVTVRILMLPRAVAMAPVSVVARQHHSPTLADYYDKLENSKRGIGRGLDREIMQRYAGLELIKALQLIPGVEDGRSLQPEGVTLTVPKMRNGCIPLTFLDRVPIAPDQLATMDPGDLEGVLVYIGGQQTPAEFSRLSEGSDCGMILAYRIAASKQKSTRSFLNALIILGAFAAVAMSFGW